MNGMHAAHTAEFEGMTAVVTGAAQGIGLAIAEELHARGAHLVLIDRNATLVKQAACEMLHEGRGVVDFIVADLGQPQMVAGLTREVAALHPQVSVLVNNAAIEMDLSFCDITADAWDQVIAVNLRAPLLVSQAIVPLFSQQGGAIVNISSIHASYAFPSAIPYACSKAGLIALTRNLALELAPRGIRVNAVCPGYIDTALWETWLRSASNPEELASRTTALHPLGRRGLPSDVASAVAYLAGPSSAWVTGTHLVVDGGLTIRAHP